MQTYTPFSPSIQFARHHDFTGYFQQELEFRERCDFPPFKHAILITVRSAHEGRAKLSAETLKRRLSEALPEEFILGDATPAPLEKLQGQFRFHILIRGEAIMRMSRLVRETLDKLPFPEDVTVTVDVDPYQLLIRGLATRLAIASSRTRTFPALITECAQSSTGRRDETTCILAVWHRKGFGEGAETCERGARAPRNVAYTHFA